MFHPYATAMLQHRRYLRKLCRVMNKGLRLHFSTCKHAGRKMHIYYRALRKDITVEYLIFTQVSHTKFFSRQCHDCVDAFSL